MEDENDPESEAGKKKLAFAAREERLRNRIFIGASVDERTLYKARRLRLHYNLSKSSIIREAIHRFWKQALADGEIILKDGEEEEIKKLGEVRYRETVW